MTAVPRRSTLTSDLALLAIDPDSGRLRGAIGYGLAAAALLDLALLGRVALLGPAAVVTDERPTGDGTLDEALCRLIEERGTRQAAHWIRVFGRRRDLRERMLRSLEAGGLIRRLDDHIFPPFPAERYSVVSPRLRPYLVARVRATLLDRHAEATDRDIGLAALLAPMGMLDRFFARDERELAHLRVASFTRESPLRSAIVAALQEIDVVARADPADAGVSATTTVLY